MNFLVLQRENTLVFVDREGNGSFNVCVFVCMCVWVYVRVLCVCMCVCMCLYWLCSALISVIS
jgi:hypothetical protein